MLIAGYVFLGLFVLTSIFHLVVCFLEKEAIRKITKIFCLLFLTLMALFLAYDKPLIYFGSLFGLIGDYFLIEKNSKISFTIGVISFMVGHIFYMGQIISTIEMPSFGYPLFYGALILFLIIFSITLYPKTKSLAGKVSYLGNAYYGIMIVNLIMSLVLAIISSIHLQFILIFLGYILFLFSDSFLLYTSYVKDVKRRDFYIMLTYLLAQFLIVISLVFI